MPSTPRCAHWQRWTGRICASSAAKNSLPWAIAACDETPPPLVRRPLPPDLSCRPLTRSEAAMTPQERELITALLARLQQQANQPKDTEAEALIRQGMAAQPDAPYLLVQTVLIQDMALHNAQERIAALEQQVAARAAAPQSTSFLGGRGSVPAAGPWQRQAPPQPAAAPVWTGG